MASEAKIKGGIFVSSQIREPMKDHDVEESLNRVEKASWMSFKKLITEYRGNRKVENYGELVSEIIILRVIMCP